MRIFEIIKESGSVSGGTLSFPEFAKTMQLFLDGASDVKWNVSEPEDDTYLFSAENDFESFSKLVIEDTGDGFFEYGHGIVLPNGQTEIFERDRLPLDLSSVDRVANTAVKKYFDVDLSDWAVDDENFE